jgi:5'-nucleotidase
MQNKPLILITNDDGYRAPGISHLMTAAQKYGEVIVVAPMEGQSGMSHAVTMNSPIRLKQISEEPGMQVYACSGKPADAVKIALNQILDRKPDLILSGINHGSNSSVSLFYSGTVAAAIEGCMNGIDSIAFSVDDHSMNADFRLAVQYIDPIIREALKNGIPKRTCLNINFPKIAPEECLGIKVCRQTNGVWKEEFEHRKDPHGRDYYWLTGYFTNQEPNEDDTDDYLLQHKYAAIVPIKVDVTDYEAMGEIEKWEIG